MGKSNVMRSFIMFSSSAVIRVIISRRVRGAGHVIRTVEVRNAYEILF
jgi:hypothetical protein